MKYLLKLAFVFGLLLSSAPAWSVEPSEMLSNPVLEARARALSEQLRCLVCQNESIDEFHADLARDIRVLIREKIAKGESNDQIRDFLVARYGDFILLKPPFKAETLLLWLTAPLTLALGGIVIFRASRRPVTATAALSEDEERQLAANDKNDAKK